MKQHRIWTLSPDGQAIAVAHAAPTRKAAEQALRQQGYRLLKAAPSKLWRPSWRTPVPRLGSLRYDEMLAQQLQVLTRSGVGPVESLRALAAHADGDYAQVLAEIRARLEGGASLADAVHASTLFDPLLVALLRAAERTSDLDMALGRFLQHRQRSNALRQRIVTTAVYPMLLMAVGTAVLLLLLLHVVPRFSGIFQTMHVELPWAATLMLRWGALVRGHMAWALAGLAAVVVAAAVLAGHGSVRSRALAKLSRTGWLGRQLRLAGLCRYYHAVASLVGGGIPLPQSLEMATRLLPQHLQAAGETVLRRVNEGVAPAAALQDAGLATAVSGQLAEVGQRTGQFGPMLERAADFHEAEVAQQVERFMRVLEPTVMTVVGIAIGVVVVLMYLPIFELASALR